MKKIIVPVVVVLVLGISFCLASAEEPITISKGNWHHFDLRGFWESIPDKPRGVHILFSGQPSKEAFTLTLSNSPTLQYVLHFSINADIIEVEGCRFKVLRVDQKSITVEKLGK